MIKVKDIETTEEVFNFLKELKLRQRELELQKEVYFSSISLYTALKYKICFKNLLLHPTVLCKKSYYDLNPELTKNELVEKLSEVLTYEFTIEQKLTDFELKQIVKIHKKIKSNV